MNALRYLSLLLPSLLGLAAGVASVAYARQNFSVVRVAAFILFAIASVVIMTGLLRFEAHRLTAHLFVVVMVLVVPALIGTSIGEAVRTRRWRTTLHISVPLLLLIFGLFTVFTGYLRSGPGSADTRQLRFLVLHQILTPVLACLFLGLWFLVTRRYARDETGEDDSRFRPENFPSPNCDERPGNAIVDTVVVHATVLESIEDVIRHFAAADTKVSAHYTIGRDGRIVSHVPENKRAWHAGQSRMKDGRTQVNDFSIGIELVNRNDGIDPFPASQIQSLRRLLKWITSRHDVKFIVPHYECADPPGRKSDPAGYDETWIRDILNRNAG